MICLVPFPANFLPVPELRFRFSLTPNFEIPIVFLSFRLLVSPLEAVEAESVKLVPVPRFIEPLVQA